ATRFQYYPVIVPDGTGGAIAAWWDLRADDGSFSNSDIYAQHVQANGAVDAAWPADGRALCTAVGLQYSPAIVADGDGGAIVVWHDNRSGATADLYAPHVLGGGGVDAAWPLDGSALCTA